MRNGGRGRERGREFEGRVRAASRRGITNWVVPVDEKRGLGRTLSTVLDVFVDATSTATAAAAAAEKRGSRLVGVVHHRVNWRCSGHSVNPGRSITAKRPRCSSSKRASRNPPRNSPRRRRAFSLLFLRAGGRGATPFDFPKKKAAGARPPRTARVWTREDRVLNGRRLLNGSNGLRHDLRVTKYQNNVTNKYTERGATLLETRLVVSRTAAAPICLTNGSRINRRARLHGKRTFGKSSG